MYVYACICKYMYMCAMSMFRDVHICIFVSNGNAMCVSQNVYINFKLSTIIIIVIIYLK